MLQLGSILKHCSRWGEGTVLKDQVLCDSIQNECSEGTDLCPEEVEQWLLKWDERKWEITAVGWYPVSFWGDKNVQTELCIT